MTHPLDLAITAAALARGFPFVGLIGSKTKRARFEKRFRALGIPEERMRALACPIGVPRHRGKEPAVIAASVAAQLLAERERIAAPRSADAGAAKGTPDESLPGRSPPSSPAPSRSRASTWRRGEGGPFGAVIVRHGQVLAEGWNQVTSTNDPTAHAEVVAIRRACAAVDTFALEGATLYASCEPCPMCLAVGLLGARLAHRLSPTRATRRPRSASTTPSSTTRCRRRPAERLMPMQHAPTEEARGGLRAIG